jgi:hypothetical protein
MHFDDPDDEEPDPSTEEIVELDRWTARAEPFSPHRKSMPFGALGSVPTGRAGTY